MASTWRTRKAGLKCMLAKKSPDMELTIPAHFRCPISLEIMKDPVTVSTGITYDRQSIETWLDLGNGTCPVTHQELKNEDLIPNHSIRKMIQDWCVENRSYGIERISTPRIPVTATQVSDMLTELAMVSQQGDRARSGELAAKIKALAKESERNRRCFASNGAGRALAASFGEFASQAASEGSVNVVLMEILSALTVVFPLDEEAIWHIGQPESLQSILSILRCGDLAGRFNAVVVVKHIVSSCPELTDVVAETDGLIEALVKLIKEPISPQTTKASLVATFYLVNGNEATASKFVDLGLVPLLLEILVDPEKSLCEKALAVLDGLLSCEEGREKAYNNALAMPVLVKKMFRVSDMATEFAVSALWKLCKNSISESEDGEGREGCLVEALQVGAFQKLLLLLQVGCSGPTKEKATDLLKHLNRYRRSSECIDTADFKGLKRPFE